MIEISEIEWRTITDEEGASLFLVGCADFAVQFRIKSRQGAKARRQIALQIQQLLLPLNQKLLVSHIDDLGSEAKNIYGRPGTQPDRRRVCEESTGLKYRLRRLELGISLRELARLAQVDYSHLSQVERGWLKMSDRMQARLNHILFGGSDPASGLSS